MCTIALDYTVALYSKCIHMYIVANIRLKKSYVEQIERVSINNLQLNGNTRNTAETNT